MPKSSLTLDELLEMGRPKTMIEKLENLLHDNEEYRPIPSYPGYYITSESRVISCTQKNPTVLSQWSKETSEAVVELRKRGEAHQKSVKVLYDDAFGTYMEPLSETEAYLLEEYGDSEEVREWVKEHLAPLIVRRGD